MNILRVALARDRGGGRMQPCLGQSDGGNRLSGSRRRALSGDCDRVAAAPARQTAVAGMREELSRHYRLERRL